MRGGKFRPKGGGGLVERVKFHKFLKFISSRFFITALLILLQVWWLVALFTNFVGDSQLFSAFFQIFSICVVLYIISKVDVPGYKIGWIILIFVFPLFGGLLYILLGENRPAKYLRKRLEDGGKNHDLYMAQDSETLDELRECSPRIACCASYISEYGHFPLWDGSSVQYHSLGEYQYADMLEELKKAEKFIFLEYFIIEEGEMWNTIFDILAEKAAQGVDVRLIYDDFGCLIHIPANYARKLEKRGVRCLVFNPFIPIISAVMNNRDHRKIMVIDGKTAFTGGINLSDEYINRRVRFGKWKDTGVMVKGKAVWSFTNMFLELWNAYNPEDEDFTDFYVPEPFPEARGFVQPFSDSPLDGETLSSNVYLDILAQAKDYVYIFTPYLAISDEMNLALIAAAKRGVDVRMVLPGIPDKKLAYQLSRSYFEPLLKAGVRIYEYTPGFIHAKSYVSDDEIAVVGTINMDYRSLYLHFECGVAMYGCPAVTALRRDAEETFAVSREVQMGEGHKTKLGALVGAFCDAILRLFAPLF